MIMATQENILGRIREALRVPAAVPGQLHGDHSLVPTDSAAFRKYLPKTGADFEENCQLFAANAAGLKADFVRLPDFTAAAAAVKEIASRESWRRLATHRGAATDAICQNLGLDLLYTDQPCPTADLEKCEAGLSACEALVGQTGSVLITSRSCGGRALSVLPPHHVVVATREQLLPDLPAAFAHIRQKYQANFPSCISFITGPSRTGDIERILVLGAHGPKKLTILLVG